MPQADTTGDSKALGMKASSQVPSGRGGLGAAETFAESINLSRTPVSQAMPVGNDGRVDAIGDTVTLGTTPVKGLGDAASITMSERSLAQSKPGR